MKLPSLSVAVISPLTVLALSAAAGIWLHLLPRNKLPQHLKGHPVLVEPDLISEDVGEKLRTLVSEIGESSGYPTNVADTAFYHTEHEHIGEAVKMVDGRCEHPYMVPSRDRNECVLAGRIDIGVHLAMTGGARGLREVPQRLFSRVQSFGAYHFDLGRYAVVEALFHERRFQRAAKAVCPAERQFLDPFQFNFIIQVPGQTVAMHLDGVYFWGASRFQFPQWLLAAMKFSGLWEREFVDQVQVVGYLHRWSPAEERSETKQSGSGIEEDMHGSFVYWDDDEAEAKVVEPRPLSGSIVDGSKTVHAASVYRALEEPPYIDKSIAHWLRKVPGEEDRWTLSREGGEADQGETILRNYTFDDLRISIVYRGRCFRDEEEAIAFRAQLHGSDGTGGRIALQDVLSTFVQDLVERGRWVFLLLFPLSLSISLTSLVPGCLRPRNLKISTASNSRCLS